MSTYEVLYPISHSKDGKVYQPGDVVSLDHLPEADQKLLVDRGYVQKSQKKLTPVDSEQRPEGTQP